MGLYLGKWYFCFFEYYLLTLKICRKCYYYLKMSSKFMEGMNLVKAWFSYILSLFPATGAIVALLMPCPFPPHSLCSCPSLCLEHSSITYANDSFSLPSGLNSNFTFPGRPPLVRPPHFKVSPLLLPIPLSCFNFFLLRTHHNLTSCVFYCLYLLTASHTGV